MIRDQALDWVIRQRDPAFDAWEAFHDWLAADPVHAEIYHELAVDDATMEELIPPAPAVQPKQATRRYWLGAAVAASLAAVVGYGMIGHVSADPYRIETAPGARRLVALSDGSSITLNGNTRLVLDHGNDRIATLERGEALFAVVHDEKRPFRVTVGAATLIDVGTRFNVVREGNVTRVAVSEGAVVYNPDVEAVRLDPGRSLRAVDGDPTIALADVPAASVASWKSGRLVYDGQPMREVAADLARYYGQPVAIAPTIADRPYHGVISLDSAGDITRLGPLLDAQVRRDGAGWKISARR